MPLSQLGYDMDGGFRLSDGYSEERLYDVMCNARLFYLAALRGHTMHDLADVQEYGEKLKRLERGDEDTILTVYSMTTDFKARILCEIGEIYMEFMDRFFECFKNLLYSEYDEKADFRYVVIQRVQKFASVVQKEASMTVFNQAIKFWDASSQEFVDDEGVVLNDQEDLAYLRGRYIGMEFKLDNAFTFFIGVHPASKRLVFFLRDRTGRIKITNNSADEFSNFIGGAAYPQDQWIFLDEDHLDNFNLELA